MVMRIFENSQSELIGHRNKTFQYRLSMEWLSICFLHFKKLGWYWSKYPNGNICPWRSPCRYTLDNDGASVQRAHKHRISECLRQPNQTATSTICFGKLFSQWLVTIYDYSSGNQCSWDLHVYSRVIYVYTMNISTLADVYSEKW